MEYVSLKHILHHVARCSMLEDFRWPKNARCFYLHRVSKIMSIAATTWPLKIENNLCQHCLESGRYCNIHIHSTLAHREKKSLKKTREQETRPCRKATKPRKGENVPVCRYTYVHMLLEFGLGLLQL